MSLRKVVSFNSYHDPPEPSYSPANHPDFSPLMIVMCVSLAIGDPKDLRVVHSSASAFCYIVDSTIDPGMRGDLPRRKNMPIAGAAPCCASLTNRGSRMGPTPSVLATSNYSATRSLLGWRLAPLCP